MDGGGLPGATHQVAREMLGQAALNELVFWIASYAGVSMVLNAFDVPSEAEWSE